MKFYSAGKICIDTVNFNFHHFTLTRRKKEALRHLDLHLEETTGREDVSPSFLSCRRRTGCGRHADGRVAAMVAERHTAKRRFVKQVFHFSSSNLDSEIIPVSASREKKYENRCRPDPYAVSHLKAEFHALQQRRTILHQCYRPPNAISARRGENRRKRTATATETAILPAKPASAAGIASTGMRFMATSI